MNEKDIVTAAMETCGWNQETLAIKCGYTRQSSISSRLHGKSMRVDTFVKLLSVMGYEVVVRSTSPNTNKNKWIVGSESVNRSDSKINLDTLLSASEPVKPVEMNPTSRKIRIKLSDVTEDCVNPTE